MNRQQWYFLRGLVRGRHHWHGFIEAFERRFPDRKIGLLDLPGNGELFLERSPASVPKMMERVRQDFLAQKIPGHDGFIFALSLGGMVGIEWLLRYPEDFQGAVLVNTSLAHLSPPWQRMRPGAVVNGLKTIGNITHYDKEILLLENTSNCSDQYEIVAKEWAKEREIHPVSVPNSLRQILAAARYKPARKPTQNILLLSSTADRLVSFECSKAIAVNYNWKLQLHSSAGHDLTLDDPKWCLDQVDSFTQ